jgi:hypothetical protein
MSEQSRFAEIAKTFKPGPNPATEPGWQEAVLAATGLSRLPPSYAEYVRHLGGTGEWINREKDGAPHFLEIYAQPELFTNTRDLLVTILDMAAQENQPELAAASRGLIPFGTDTDRIFFCWDPARVDDRGELAVVMLDNNADLVVETVARDLFELLRNYDPKN